MNCEAVRPLLHAHVDGELDLVRDLEVERHLQTCPACSAACQNIRSLQSALRSLLPPAEPPATLEMNLRAALRRASLPARGPWWRRRPFFLSLAVLLVVATGLFVLWMPSFDERRLAREVSASHARSRQDGQPLEFLSSDPETLKPWFKAKLKFTPPVPDLSKDGFDLAGGRLDRLDNRAAAAVVYRADGHVIDLLVWPTTTATDPHDVRTARGQGYRMVHWWQGGKAYWAVSDLDAGELRRFSDLVRKASPGYCPP
jgi:anti-sigma factor RsiW